MTKHTYYHNKHTSTPLSKLNQHWTDVPPAVYKYRNYSNMTRTLSLDIISCGFNWASQLCLLTQIKPSLIGDTGDELVISLINQRLDAQHNLYYRDVKADVQHLYNQTHRTRSSGPARSLFGNSTVTVHWILSATGWRCTRSSPIRYKQQLL